MAINAQDALHVLVNVLVDAITHVLDVATIAPKAAQVYAAAVALLHAVVLVLAHAQAVLLLVAYLVTVVVVQAVQVIAQAALAVLGAAVLATLIVLAAVVRTVNLNARNLVGLLALVCV